MVGEGGGADGTEQAATRTSPHRKSPQCETRTRFPSCARLERCPWGQHPPWAHPPPPSRTWPSRHAAARSWAAHSTCVAICACTWASGACTHSGGGRVHAARKPHAACARHIRGCRVPVMHPLCSATTSPPTPPPTHTHLLKLQKTLWPAPFHLNLPNRNPPLPRTSTTATKSTAAPPVPQTTYTPRTPLQSHTCTPTHQPHTPHNPYRHNKHAHTTA